MIPSHLDDVVRSLQAIEAIDGGRAALDSPRRCDYDWGGDDARGGDEAPAAGAGTGAGGEPREAPPA